MENYTFKRIYNLLKAYIKMGKNINFGDINKTKVRQHREPTPIKNIDTNKITVSSLLLWKKIEIFYLLQGCQKKLDLYVHFFPKWLHIENTFM